MKTFESNINSRIKDASNSLPLGCMGLIVAADPEIKAYAVQVYDEQSGKQMRYGGVKPIDEKATYVKNEYVYVSWMGGQRTNPVIIGSLKNSAPTNKSDTQNGTDTNGTETSDMNTAKAGYDGNMQSLLNSLRSGGN